MRLPCSLLFYALSSGCLRYFFSAANGVLTVFSRAFYNRVTRFPLFAYETCETKDLHNSLSYEILLKAG